MVYYLLWTISKAHFQAVFREQRTIKFCSEGTDLQLENNVEVFTS